MALDALARMTLVLKIAAEAHKLVDRLDAGNECGPCGDPIATCSCAFAPLRAAVKAYLKEES